MRIIIDGRLLSNKPTGISRYTLELIKSYQAQYGKSSVKVVCDKKYYNADFERIPTHLKPYRLLDFILFYFFLRRYQFDIYHSAFYSGLLFRMKKITQILTVHDLMFYKVPGFFSENAVVNFIAKFYYKFIVWVSIISTDIVVSVSETTAADLKGIFGFDSIVISEGVLNNESVLNSEIDEFDLFTSNSLEKGKYFLYVGNNRRHKNIPFLVNSFRTAHTENKLVLLGFHDENLKHYDWIVNINTVNDAELALLYRFSKAFIFPSLYEGFGLPILEAISNNCVVFSSNEGALSEFKFKSIQFFNPRKSDELVELINKADQFSFQNEDTNLLKLYDWQLNFNIFQEYLKKFLAIKNKI